MSLLDTLNPRLIIQNLLPSFQLISISNGMREVGSGLLKLDIQAVKGLNPNIRLASV